MIRRHGLAALVAFLALGLAAVAARADEAPLGATVDGLLAYAREHNPELRAAGQEAAAARERVAPAGALPDPNAEIDLMDFTNAMASSRAPSLIPGQVGTTKYTISQPLPFWGKRGLRGEVAEAEAGRADETRRSTGIDLTARIKTAFARHYQAVGQARILRETLDLVQAIERVALTRYGVGLVPQQDVLAAQSEITSLKVDLVGSERSRRDALASLNTLLPRRADAPLAEPARLPPLPTPASLDALNTQLAETSPELAADRHDLTAAEKNRDLTYRNRYPDFAVGLTREVVRDGINTWDVMFQMSIPLQQSSRRAQEREAEHRIEASRARLDAAHASLEGRLGQSLAALESSRDSARLLRDTLLPQADATLKAAQSGYETGRVNFTTLIDAERQILRTRLSLLDAEVEAATRAAELEQIVGAPL